MRVMTFNCNGIRSAARKGFFDWLPQADADVVCLQETKAQEHQLSDAVYAPSGYHCHFFDALKKGYSGTAILARREPDRIIRGFGCHHADTEGRYLQADFGDLSVVSLYMPSGSSGEERQSVKFSFLREFLPHLRTLRESGRQFILCGDWNMCHREIDLKNWKSNRKNSGFLPEEREWLDNLFAREGFIDAFRHLNQEADQYTWWSQRGQARAKNVGWRLDYHVITPGLLPRVETVEIYTAQNFSDHAPVTMQFGMNL
jgi:exodeoxyribonuclease III